MRNSRVERVVYNCEHCEERYAFSSHVKYLHTARLTGEFLGPLRVYVLYGSSNKPRSFVSIYTWNLQIPMSNRIPLPGSHSRMFLSLIATARVTSKGSVFIRVTWRMAHPAYNFDNICPKWIKKKRKGEKKRMIVPRLSRVKP